MMRRLRFYLPRVAALTLIMAVSWRAGYDFDRYRPATSVTPPHTYADINAYLSAQYVPPTGGTDSDLAAILRVPDCADAPELVKYEPVADAIQRLTITACGLRVTGLYAEHANAPLVFAIHGTRGTPEIAFGLAVNEDIHHRFAARLYDAGYSVFAPEIVTQPALNQWTDTNALRNELDKRARAIGYTLVGIEMRQLMLALDYFSAERVAVYGISLGGLLAFHWCALDTRLDACIVSQYIEDRHAKLFDDAFPYATWRYANSDYVTFDGYLRTFDDVQIARLISPRPLFIESASLDSRAASVPRVAEAMRAAGANVTYTIPEGGHEIHFDDAATWLEEQLLDK